VSEALESRVREVRTRHRENKEERDRLAAQLKAEEELPQESDAIKGRVDALMRKLKWSNPVSADPEERASNLASALSEYASIVEQAGTLPWTPAPATLQGLNAYCAETAKIIEKCEELIKAWTGSNTLRTRRETELRSLNSAIEQARDAKLLIEAGVPRRTIEAGRHMQDSTRIAAQLAGTDALNRGLLEPYLTLDLKAAQRQAAAASKSAEAKRNDTRKRLTDFTALREKAQNLAQQLRAIAEQILKSAGDPDVCPLCHTLFEEGELTRHMHDGVDDTVEATGQALLQLIRTQDAALDASRSVEQQIEILVAFVGRAGAAKNIEVAAALKLLDGRTREFVEVSASLNRVEAELRELEARNLSQARFQRSMDQLLRLGRPLENPTLQGVTAFESGLSVDVANAQTHLEAQTVDVARSRGELQQLLSAALASVEDAIAAIARLKERLTTTQTVLDKLAKFTGAFPWPARFPLADLLVSVRQVRSLAAELQTALQREARRRQAQSEATTRKDELDRRLAQLEPVRDRLVTARDTLKELKEQNALTSAMQSALQANRDAIEAIFARIHAPPEFTRLGDDFKSLLRSNGEQADLAEISTGQRAAFALSIFLARNAQLVAAPPVILIDDPIAHVDDFNALSFLDYLRTLVIAGGRQIFFATANDKIAALFERKFDFLGSEFCRLNLAREAA